MAGLTVQTALPDEPVLGHGNWPLPPAKTLPLRLLGYDQRKTLYACVDVIDRWRAGNPSPENKTPDLAFRRK